MERKSEERSGVGPATVTTGKDTVKAWIAVKQRQEHHREMNQT
jgi:hypothetical protein